MYDTVHCLRVGRVLLVAQVALVLAIGMWSSPPTAAEDKPAGGNNAIVEDALIITVPNPLTGEAVKSIGERLDRAMQQTERPVRKIVFDFNPDDKDASTADFGQCYELASKISKLGGVLTIGFIHGKLSAHTVLPVLACKELVMSSEARVGPILTEGVAPVREGTAAAVGYGEILGDSRASLLAAVRKMYDPTIALGVGIKNGDWYVDLNKPDAIKTAGVLNPRAVPAGPPGRVASYDIEAMKAFGLCKKRAENMKELSDEYQIQATVDILGNRSPVPFHYVLRGDVDRGMKESLDRLLGDMKRKNGNVLYLELQCTGTDLDVARDIADKLRAHQTGPDAVKIVAFIPDRAPDAATFLALACSEIVMSKRKDTFDPNRPEEHHEAEIGDFEASLGKIAKTPAKADLFRRSLHELAELQGYPAILADGMFDRDLEIVRARSKTDLSRRRVMTKADFDADAANWTLEKQVKAKNHLLKLNTTLAAELGIARRTVENQQITDVYAADGISPSQVKEMEPGWLDQFADFLKRPSVTVILVLVGFIGMILELKVPGLTVPGITAALCFILVFWSQSRFSGETFVLALMLFMLGLTLIALEIFVLPGFGAPGVVGALCVLSGLALVTMQQVPQTLSEWGEAASKMAQYLVALVVAIGASLYIAKFLPNIPGANRLLLTPPTDKGDAAAATMLPGMEQAASLLGAIGTCNTALRPAGVVRFGEQFVDVVSEGDYIPPGARVQVIEVEGTRIVVKEV